MKKILIAILGFFLLCGEDTGATCQKCSSYGDCTLNSPSYNNICLTGGTFQGCCGCTSSADCQGVNGGPVGVICAATANPTSPSRCVGGCNSNADCSLFNGGSTGPYVCSKNNQCVPYCNNMSNPCPPGNECIDEYCQQVKK